MERALLDLLSVHSSLALAACDADGTLTLMTPALERLLGVAYEPVGEAELPARMHLFHQDGRTPLTAADTPMARARMGEQVIDAVVTSRRSDAGGALVHMRCNAAAVRDEGGQICGAVVLIQDITDQQRWRDRQTDLRERLVVTINHELRTPVTKLLGHSELLLEVAELVPDWAGRSLRAVHRAACDLADLSATITRLVDLEGAANIKLAHCDLVPAIRAIVERHHSAQESRGVTVVLTSAPRVAATVDLSAATRAVEELVKNAVAFAPQNTCVEVALLLEQDAVVVTVADLGPGIAATDYIRLLQPFERGGQPDGEVSSRGLGLAYARAIAVAHGGELDLRANQPTGLVAEWRVSRFGGPMRTGP